MPPFTPQDIIDQTNAYRKEKGLLPLTANPELMKAAQERANDMAITGNFSHSVATSSPLTSYVGFIEKNGYGGPGYSWNHAGENLARDFSDATSTMQALRKSPTHDANLVSPNYADTGVAVVNSKDGRPYVVQFFGNKAQNKEAIKQIPVVPQEKSATIVKQTIAAAKPLPVKPIDLPKIVQKPLTATPVVSKNVSPPPLPQVKKPTAVDSILKKLGVQYTNNNLLQ